MNKNLVSPPCNVVRLTARLLSALGAAAVSIGFAMPTHAMGTQSATRIDIQRNAAPVNAAHVSQVLRGANGLTAISEGRLLRWASAEKAWQDIGPDAEGSIHAAQFVDTARAFALEHIGDTARLWATQDGGARWHALNLPTTEAAPMRFHFANANQGWLIVRQPSSSNFSIAQLYATHDGGATWQELAAPPAMGTLDIGADGLGWLTGGPGGARLYQTRDAGATWTELNVAGLASPEETIAITAPTRTQDGVYLGILATNETDGTPQQRLLQVRINASKLQVVSQSLVKPIDERPARLIGDGDTLILAGAVVVAESKKAAPLKVLIDASGTAKALLREGASTWLLREDGQCSGKVRCETTSEVAQLSSGGLGEAIVPPVARAVSANITEKRVVQSTNRGFDACTAQSLSTLQTWRNSSPYKDVNFYMGGRNRACSQANLSASWITGALDQGWNLIPTWVGYQSPTSICTGCAKYSTNSSTARTQGIDEANLAADAAEALGLTKPNIIYFNLEKYNTESASDKSFIDGWSERIKQRGYVPGMYVHWTNVASFTSIANPPEGVWVARWSGSGGTAPSTAPNPNSITGVSDSIFVNKRIWQHYGDVNQSWGGVSIAIDMNVANGPTVGKDVAQQPQSITFGALSNRVINTAAFNVSATASSGLAVTFVSGTSSVCTVSGTRVTMLAVGTCSIVASQAGNASYTAATTVTQSFSIAAQTQSITFATLPSRVLSAVTFDLNANTSSGLLPSYSSLTTSVCTVSGDRLLTVALGTCTVRASQSGNAKVTAAASVDQSFSVIAQSACSLANATDDCDMDAIPNGIEASVSRNASVKDNDVFANTGLFIRQMFRDFLKREATSTEVSTWTTEFNAGRATRASMIESFLSNASFGAKHAPVARLYLGAFNRVPQWSGQNYWAGQVGIKTVAQIADAFVTSAEFTTTYGTLDDTPYINRIYQNVLGRTPTSTELTNGLNDLASGAKTRGGLLAALTEGTTFQNSSRSEVNMIMIYWGMLQRRADQSGFNYWVGQLDTGAKTTQGAISGFLGSTEYRSRFLP